MSMCPTCGSAVTEALDPVNSARIARALLVLEIVESKTISADLVSRCSDEWEIDRNAVAACMLRYGSEILRMADEKEGAINETE